MNFFSKPPEKSILMERVRDTLGMVKTRLLMYPAAIIVLTIIKLISPLPISNLVLIILGYSEATSLLFLYLLKKWKDNPKVIIALDIGQGLFLIEIVLYLLIIYYLGPTFIYLFGSFVWLAFFFYIFYASMGIGPEGYSYSRGYINTSFLLSSLCSAIVFFWECSGIAPSYDSLAFLPGSLYQKPIPSLILFLLLMVVFTGARSFNKEVWKKFREVNQQLRQKTEELGTLNRVLEERVKERTQELEEAKTVLEIKVEARTKELKELAESLEKQIKERTKELQGRVNELERIHRLTVGRELKMIVLKEEIERLKEELEKYKPST